MHLNNQLLFDKYCLSYFTDNLQVLEVGAGEVPTEFCKKIDNDSINWHTLTVDFAGDHYTKPHNATIISKAPYNYPIEDNKYDITLSSNVMEHVPDINSWYKELIRITKPGGVIITMLPISYPYHTDPIDCWRIYPDGFSQIVSQFNVTIELNKFESLEKELIPNWMPTVPGRSIYNNKGKNRYNYQYIVNRLAKTTGLTFIEYPFEVAYDTINISRKVN